jgi:hypothetical protein
MQNIFYKTQKTVPVGNAQGPKDFNFIFDFEEIEEGLGT